MASSRETPSPGPRRFPEASPAPRPYRRDSSRKAEAEHTARREFRRENVETRCHTADLATKTVRPLAPQSPFGDDKTRSMPPAAGFISKNRRSIPPTAGICPEKLAIYTPYSRSFAQQMTAAAPWEPLFCSTSDRRGTLGTTVLLNKRPPRHPRSGALERTMTCVKRDRPERSL